MGFLSGQPLILLISGSSDKSRSQGVLQLVCWPLGTMVLEKVCLLFPQDGHLRLHLLFGPKLFLWVLWFSGGDTHWEFCLE